MTKEEKIQEAWQILSDSLQEIKKINLGEEEKNELVQMFDYHL